MIDNVNHSSQPAQRAQHQQLSRSFSGLSSAESAQWPFRGSAFHLDSRRRSSFHLDSHRRSTFHLDSHRRSTFHLDSRSGSTFHLDSRRRSTFHLDSRSGSMFHLDSRSGSTFHLDSRSGSSFHLDSRSALVKSVERAAKQQQLSDGYQSVFDQLPTGQCIGELHVDDVVRLLLYLSSVVVTF